MHWNYVFLIFSGIFAGIVNAVAGGGSLIMYPLLLSMGLTPIVANATTSFSIWPGALSSAWGYRKYVRKLPKHFYILLVPSLVGGMIGAYFLKHTSNHAFESIVPWFIILGVILLLAQPRIHKWLASQPPKKGRKYRFLVFSLITILLFGLSIYGGYFGAGFGIIMLAFLGFTELSNIHEMNGLKNLAGATLNISATAYFIYYKLIDWRLLPILLAGSVIGGLIGSVYSSRLPSKSIRILVIAIGTIVAAVLLVKLYI
jgi:uncharacterized membrane protein YfcA